MAMSSRERLATILRGELPDCVAAAPDISNMIPARLTGKPFWDLYLYNDPPIWEAYVQAARSLDIDSLMDGYCPLVFPDERPEVEAKRFIVMRNDERIVVQDAVERNGTLTWSERVTVYYVADPPTHNVRPETIGLPVVPNDPRPLEGVAPPEVGPDHFARVKAMLGDQGLIGAWLTTSAVLKNTEAIYDYYDNTEKYRALAEHRIIEVERRFERIMAMETRPDFLCVGGSGSLVFQTPEIFREIALPAVKRGIELASAAGIPTHMHSCGPETALVAIMAEQTDLTVIDPLEAPPMGDCDLADLKRRFGDRIVLKGNLLTTDVMLRGSVDDVRRAARKAIDDAGEGGRFILSTGDQCGRDTPLDNLRALVDVARSYGRY